MDVWRGAIMNSCNCLGAVRNPDCPEHSPANEHISTDNAIYVGALRAIAMLDLPASEIAQRALDAALAE